MSQAVKHPALSKQRSLRGIQVLGLARAQPPGAEGDDAPPAVADGEHDPPPEAVIGVSVVRLVEEAGLEKGLGLHALAAERGLEAAPGIYGEAEAKGGDCGVVQAAAP